MEIREADIAAMGATELEELIDRAVRPDVPLRVLFAALDRYTELQRPALADEPAAAAGRALKAVPTAVPTGVPKAVPTPAPAPAPLSAPQPPPPAPPAPNPAVRPSALVLPVAARPPAPAAAVGPPGPPGPPASPE